MTRVIAHRGAWGATAPQNSLAAFERAIELGADMVELDVRSTAGGALVVFHDPDVDGVPVSKLTHRALRPRPALLAEALDLCRGRIDVNVEVKDAGCAPPVIALLRAFGLRACLLTSFHEEVIREARRLAPELSTGLLRDSGSPEEGLARCGAHHLVLARELVDRDLPAGCVIWTVNDPAELERYLQEPAVFAVITDVPQLALELRARLSDRTEPVEPR